MRALLVAALLVLLAPVASALDAFPTESRLGDTQARFLVRLPSGGTLRIESDEPVLVAVGPAEVDPEAFVPAPASFEVSTSEVWHGLPGVVAITAQRSDPRVPVTLEVEDGAGGVQLEWGAPAPSPAPPSPGPAPESAAGPAKPRWVPGPDTLGVLGIGAGVVALWGGRRGASKR